MKDPAMTNHASLKDGILNLPRAECLKLAKAIEARRTDLEDFAEHGGELTEEQVSKMSKWFGIYRLRQQVRLSPINHHSISMSDFVGISSDQLNEFAHGSLDLDAETTRKLIAYRNGLIDVGYVPHKTPTVTPMTAQPANGGIPDAIARRGAAFRALSALSTAELEAIVASLKGRRAA